VNQTVKRAKVVIFTTVHRATDDRIFHKEAKTLAKAGYEVVLFGNAPHDSFTDGVRIRALGKASSRLTRLAASFRILRHVLSERGDIYHFHDPELILAGLILRLLGKKVIYDVHEDYPKDILGKPYLPRWLRPLVSAAFRPAEAWAARRMGAVITATDAIQKRFPGSAVLHNYPILNYLCRSHHESAVAKSEKPFVLYCGTISRILGALQMVKGVEGASQRYQVQLRLLGPFEDEALGSEILRRAASGTVDYRGSVPLDEVYSNFVGTVAGLVLYHPYPNHIEAMPNKIFECMACGVPLIASDFPLWRKIIYDQGCGLVVNPLDVQEIANAIIYLMEHPEEAREMGERGRELVRTKYNWQSEEKQLLSLYDALLQKKPKRLTRSATISSAP
jgi:glycosyltransferase involved in cell wall biosynthesis